MKRPRSTTFNYSRDFTTIDFRKHPELYQIGRGEQGVLLVEPYKSEILPHWRFRTVAIARESSRAIYKLFCRYRRERDFVGMDMARKFLQMGYTRARRYANYRGGRKYKPDRTLHDRQINDEKAAAALVFKELWFRARDDRTYQKLRAEHIRRYGKI